MARRAAQVNLPKLLRHSAKQEGFRRERIARTTTRIHKERGARIVIGPRGGVGVIDRRGRPIHIDWKMFERLPETVGPLLRRRRELEEGVSGAREPEAIREEIAQAERERRETGLLDIAAGNLEAFWEGVSKITGGKRDRAPQRAFRRGDSRGKGRKGATERVAELRAKHQPDLDRALKMYDGNSPHRARFDELEYSKKLPKEKAKIRALGTRQLAKVRDVRAGIRGELEEHDASISRLGAELEELPEIGRKRGELDFLGGFSEDRDLSDEGRKLTPAELAALHSFYRNFHTGKIR